MLVTLADDVAIIFVAKYMERIASIFDKAIGGIHEWIRLAERKSEKVLITVRKKMETVAFEVDNYTIKSQPYIRYLGLMIDSTLTVRSRIEHASHKTAIIATVLS